MNTTSTQIGKTVVFSKNKKKSNGFYANPVAELDEELQEIESVLERKKDLIERKEKLQKELEEKLVKQVEAEQNQLIEQKSELLAMIADAERAILLYETKADIDQTLVRIGDLRQKVAEIEKRLPQPQSLPDGEESIASTEFVEATFLERLLSSSGTLWVSLIVLVVLVFFSYHKVEGIGTEINKLNQIAQNAGDMSQMLPPSISKLSFQKMWFSWLNIFANLIVAILLMALIAPDKLIFILPFTKNNSTKWKHFFDQNEEQKQWQSFAYLACVLLFLALCHSMGK